MKDNEMWEKAAETKKEIGGTEVRKLLQRILDAWGESFEDMIVPEGEEQECSRCHVFLYIEQGGDTVDCHICKGDGVQKPERVLNHEKFSEKVEDIMFHSDETFFAVLDTETTIIN